MSPAGGPLAAALPRLRDDINIKPSAASATGEAMWVICDPIAHKYIQIDGQTRLLLAAWRVSSTVGGLIDAATSRYGATADVAVVTQLVEFMRRHHLVESSAERDWQRLAVEATRGHRSAFMRVLHGYLFFRVPLFRPQGFLTRTLPFVAFLFSKVTAVVVALIGILGLYLVSREWSSFSATLPAFYTPAGAAALAVTLAVVKTFHELGHAYTAVRYGCRVPTMGVAFMMLTPLLYTDVSDSWRLSDRGKRLFIDGAGIIVEVGLACIASAAWAFLPDGTLRSVAQLVATTGWIMSVGINLNPFMRFDGYYILCDLIGIDNLQQRAFALGQWKMRRILFAPDLPPPELLSSRLRTILITYAWVTWLYRVVLYTGIALLVYSYFFKVLGLLLFAVEIWFFLVRPIAHEFRAWRQLGRAVVSPRRAALSLSFVGAFVLLLVVPWSSSIHVPATLGRGSLALIYPPRAARIAEIHVAQGQSVQTGEAMLRLDAPELDHEIRIIEQRLLGLAMRLNRTSADIEDREETLVLRRDHQALRAVYDGLIDERNKLTVRAPTDGVIMEVSRDLQVGLWVPKTFMIASLSQRDSAAVKGYVALDALSRIVSPAQGTFIPDDPMQASTEVRLTSVAEAGATTIDVLELASVFGGPIAAESSPRGVIPVRAVYRIELAPVAGADAVAPQVVRGVVQLAGTRESAIVRAGRAVANILIRETGF
ncbi:MAG: biotin/lipoyl-binding protein [Hyphomicrobium sp.]